MTHVAHLRTSTPRRRLATATVIATAALAVSAVGTVAAPAQAATPSYANPGTSWLVKQLGSNHLLSSYGSPDYGLSIDAWLAMNASSTQSATASKVLSAVEQNASAYISPVFGGVTYQSPGGAGKLASAMYLAGHNPRKVGSLNLISYIEKQAPKGYSSDVYSLTSQAYLARALVLAKSPVAAAATKEMLRYQCPGGGFSSTPPATGKSCSSEASAEVDATASALQTLKIAQDKGTAGLSTKISAAVTWLDREQLANGSFMATPYGSSSPVSNANSTGLAAAALAAVGQNASASQAAAWLLKHQVTTASGAKLAGQVGAIAYSDDALAAGRSDGITSTTLDQWVRASTQAAAVAVPAKTFSMTWTPKLKRGSTQRITASGLSAGEPAAVFVKGKLMAKGKASSKGTFSYSFKVGVAGPGRVSVYGAFVNRSVRHSYTVTR